jgi:Tfp pilus tip-associated adhesin PilY1
VSARRVFAAAALLAAAASPLAADDRDLVRPSGAEPYVFVLFDVSGSMHWTPQCTAEQVAAGTCAFACPDGDCFAPLNGDDPASKLYQAKEALFEVVQGLSGVHLGFATYNQDALRVRGKHWLYRATGDGITLAGGQVFPRTGDQEVFGAQWACNGGNATGCAAGSPAELTNAWSRQRMLRLPKLGDANDLSRQLFVRSGGTTYRLTYSPAAGTTLGSGAFAATVTAERCNNASCSSRTAAGSRRVDYALVDQFLSWDNTPNAASSQGGYFNQGDASDLAAGNTCSGWDPNTDLAADPFSGYDLRWPTATDPPHTPWLDEGDVIPLDWRDTHKGELLRRFSPAGPLTPDFRSASYFENRPRTGESYLRLLSETRRPLLGFGSTPLGNSVRDFRTWYAGCDQAFCGDDEPGWDDIAEVQDPRWACRKKYLIVVTDGDDTCGGGGANGAACSSTASLCSQESVKTFVVAFGVDSTGGGNALRCMAANGGSNEPIFPQNKEELVEALNAIFSEIVEESRSFASAAVPTVQANAADKIYLTHFNPVQGESIWDGHLDAYLKPLPLTAEGAPDRARTCTGSSTAGCRLWDAGAVLAGQAPDAAEVAAGEFRLGLTTTTRRVFHAQADGSLRLFEAPTNEADWSDLFAGLGFDPATVAANRAAARARAEALIGQTLVKKQATLEREDGSVEDVEYVLGDLFHSDPQIIESPRDFQRFAIDFAPGEPPSAEDCQLDDEGDDTHPGYRCFAFRHQFRRKMVAVGGNDGMVHLIDAGTYVPRSGNAAAGEYTHGTGVELAAVIPRLVLPVIRQQAEETDHVYGVDGTLKPSDAFIDPDGAGDSVRQWRTVLVGGLREGGRIVGGSRVETPERSGEGMPSGYFALDVTQPDVLEQRSDVFVPTTTDVVPTCLSLDGLPRAGCGPVPFPALLWEFTDSSAVAQLDQDANGYPDLADTWSEPVIGPVRVDVDGVEETRWVAIVGGGIDPSGKHQVDPNRGNWVYMIDLETGRAIYKREVEGQVPEVAAVDANQDQYIDTLYFGTTVGRMYKVDLSSVGIMEEVPQRDLLGAETTRRMVTDPAWTPFVIFRAGDDLPLFQRPTTFFVGSVSATAIAFGSGDREELWSRPVAPGRFYVLLDEGFTRGDPTLPRTEANYVQVTSDGGTIGTDLIVQPPVGREPGWFLRLGDPTDPETQDERVITEAFGLAGVVVFSSFDPDVAEPQDGQGRPVCGGGNGNGNGNGNGGGDEPLCARTGKSKNFVVYAFNGDPIVDLGNAGNGTGADRFTVVEDFVSNPFVEQAHSQNVGASGQPLSAVQESILRRLQELYPENTRFGNYWLQVRQVLGGTGVRDIATIPIGVVLKNWKEL